jgi:hypothetical protein
MPSSESFNEISMKKWNFYMSFLIYASIYYFLHLIMLFIVFSIIQLPNTISVILLYLVFFVLVLYDNANVYNLAKKGKEKAKKDLVSPINDSETIYNKFLDWVDKWPRQLLKITKFIQRNLQIAQTYGIFLTANLVRKEWYLACDNPDFLSSKEHDGIIVIVYNKLSSSAMFGCGIDLLINHFKNNNPYKIYLCHDENEFLKIINNPKMIRIWIFGHGDRGGVSFTDGYCNYEELVKKIDPESKKKDAIYQFHCNVGYKRSLVQLLPVKKGFVNHSINDEWAIREYIKNIIEQNRFNDLIILE